MQFQIQVILKMMFSIFSSRRIVGFIFQNQLSNIKSALLSNRNTNVLAATALQMMAKHAHIPRFTELNFPNLMNWIKTLISDL